MSKLKNAVNKLKALMISAAVAKHEGNRKAAAAELGISPEGLNWNIRHLGLDDAAMMQLARTMPPLPKPSQSISPQMNAEQRRSGGVA